MSTVQRQVTDEVGVGEARPTRPALRYYGGKWRIAPWIIGYMPAHRAYLEPCMGAASVFAQKRPVEVETLNDANGRVTNYFQQLRDNQEELRRRIGLTPWAEDEYYLCQGPSEDPVEDARRFYVTSWQSVHGTGSSRSGWRWMTDPDDRRGLSPAVDWMSVDLDAFAQRLRRAHIINRDALEVIGRVAEVATCLIYFDPPYTLERRTRKDGYSAFEVTEEWHAKAAELLRAHAGPVLVSGYSSRLYEQLYEVRGWQRVDRDFQANSGSTRTESLWISPAAQAALQEEELERVRAVERERQRQAELWPLLALGGE